jgi:hypothetical protein
LKHFTNGLMLINFVKSFEELGIRVILETYTWKFPGIS